MNLARGQRWQNGLNVFLHPLLEFTYFISANCTLWPILVIVLLFLFFFLAQICYLPVLSMYLLLLVLFLFFCFFTVCEEKQSKYLKPKKLLFGF